MKRVSVVVTVLISGIEALDLNSDQLKAIVCFKLLHESVYDGEDGRLPTSGSATTPN